MSVLCDTYEYISVCVRLLKSQDISYYIDYPLQRLSIV